MDAAHFHLDRMSRPLSRVRTDFAIRLDGSEARSRRASVVQPPEVMGRMNTALDAVIEIFSWVGFGCGVLLVIVSLVMRLADGTWLPARAVIEDSETGRFVRWFDEDGEVNEAPLTHEQDQTLAGKAMADIFYRRGWRGRMRLTHGSPAVRAFGLLGLGLIGLGVVTLVLQWILLFARG